MEQNTKEELLQLAEAVGFEVAVDSLRQVKAARAEDEVRGRQQQEHQADDGE
jgi:hypothetical protein